VPTEVAVMAEQVTGRGARAVVCAAAPLAAQAGAAALRDGGNAYDAAVAAALAETVLLPPKCGLGGDLIAIVLESGATEPEALLAIGGAPAGLSAVAAAAADRPEGDPGAWSDTGPNSVGPPAAAAGYLALAGRGALPLERLAASARALALDGFPWAEVCTRLQVASRALVARWNPAGTTYFPGGDPIVPGTITRLPGLAEVLDEFVARREGFLQGPVGDAIAATVAAHGGVLTPPDFAYARAEWAACAQGTLGGRIAWATPAPTHGPSLLDAVADAAAGDDPTAQYRRVLAAIARRRDTLSDPSGTSMVSATDADGRVVVVVHSNSFPRFGSGLVVPGYDLVLANRAGRGFTARVGHPNFPVAGRRPATTLHAWMVADADGRPEFAGATPGGANQMPWNAQLLQGILDGIVEPGRLVTAPRWEWLPGDDGVRVEEGLGGVDGLAAAAPRVVPTGRWGMTSAQQVVRVHRPGRPLEGAADPRTVGLALGL
jgi:gamma-glutamyltranspeptidase/glutathione hydrolase